jgi:hypothetical protein
MWTVTKTPTKNSGVCNMMILTADSEDCTKCELAKILCGDYTEFKALL